MKNKITRVWQDLWKNHPVIMNIIASLLMVFIMEWLSRHSFSGALYFVVHHTGPYLYNSFIIFAVYSIVFICRSRQFMYVLITFLFSALGVTNCIILYNRVTPFGYTDLYMVGDLLTMSNSNYFTASQAAMVMAALAVFLVLLVMLLIKGKKTTSSIPFWKRFLLSAALLVSLVPVTWGLRSLGVLTAYFGNLAQGYQDYGYLYGFSTSVFDRGMRKPFGYSESKLTSITKENSPKSDTLTDENGPNIVVVLMESVFDVSECSFIECDQDPIPYFHYLEDNFSTGYCTVPVVGAGTCNSEFEVLTGMSCTFFGPGEYPQKTILKETDCESYADIMSDLGYSTHVVHNNGGNFYSRANAFSMMGFDTFQSKEMLDITDYTPLGSWPTDDILIGATIDAMNSTPEKDFIYTITVSTHGAYPTYEVEEDPAVKVTAKGKTEEQNYAWSYYVNRLHDFDKWLSDYCQALDSTGEDTIVILFGDHLPTMGLTEDELKTGSLYKTKYLTWNNFGMSKEDMDLASYQLVAQYLDRLGVHSGTINSYHQSKIEQGLKAGTPEYMNDLQMLQYDLLYGKRYAYQNEDPYPASDLTMGIADVTIDRAYFFNGDLYVYGSNFTKWSKIYVNGEKVSTTYKSGQVLKTSKKNVKDGDIITVCQVGSSDTIFRQSNEFTVSDPNYNLVEEEDE